MFKKLCFFCNFLKTFKIHDGVTLSITLVIADLGHWGLIPNGPGRQWPYRPVRAIGDPQKYYVLVCAF